MVDITNNGANQKRKERIMKKLIIIAMLIAMVSPAMAVQIIGPSASPSGSIPVMMTIDRFAEMLLPDQITLVSSDPQNLTAPWGNGTGTAADLMYVRANFDAEIAVSIAPRTSYLTIGTFELTLSSTSGILSAAAGVNMGDYATALLNPGATPTWEPLNIAVALTGVDLTGATYSPTAVPVADVTVTVASQ